MNARGIEVEREVRRLLRQYGTAGAARFHYETEQVILEGSVAEDVWSMLLAMEQNEETIGKGKD